MTVKEYLNTPKRKLCAALCALGASWIFLICYYSGSVDTLFPSEKQLEVKEAELKKLRKENETLKQQANVQKANEKAFAAMSQGFWKPENGVVETELRTLIQEAARSVELSLNGLGAVKTTKITETLYYAELDIQGNAPIEAITAFLEKIEQINPPLSWKRFEVRANMRPPRDASAITNDLVFSGSLRVIVSGNPEGGVQ